MAADRTETAWPAHETAEAQRVLELLRDSTTLKRELELAERALLAAQERCEQVRIARAKASAELAQLLGHLDITLPRMDGGA
jgi:outer membrane protein TolC